jgi:hypothetical protein
MLKSLGPAQLAVIVLIAVLAWWLRRMQPPPGSGGFPPTGAVGAAWRRLRPLFSKPYTKDL